MLLPPVPSCCPDCETALIVALGRWIAALACHALSCEHIWQYEYVVTYLGTYQDFWHWSVWSVFASNITVGSASCAL